MSLKADCDDLVQAAAGWDGIGKEIKAAHDLVANGSGMGDYLGAIAQLTGVSKAHDTFIQSMLAALDEGNKRMGQIADLLRDAAKAYGETDLSAKDEFHHADGTPA